MSQQTETTACESSPGLTIGQLARAAGCEPHQVLWLIRRGQIAPATRLARTRVFSHETVAVVRAILARRKGRQGTGVG